MAPSEIEAIFSAWSGREMPKPMAQGTSVFSLMTLTIEARSVFILIVDLNQGGKPQLIGCFDVCPDLGFTQNRTDQEDCRGAKHLSFIYHVLIHREVLAEAGDGYGCGDFLQVIITSEEPFGLGQNRNALGPGRLIVLRDFQVWEVGDFCALQESGGDSRRAYRY